MASMCSRMTIVLLIALWLLSVATSAHASRSLQQRFDPQIRQFVQITLSMRGTCNQLLAVSPTLLNQVRLAAVADMRRALTASPIGIMDLPATLASVRALTPNCSAVQVRTWVS